MNKDDKTLMECTEPFNNDTLTCYECMKMWARYNPSWNEDLLDKACGEEIPDSVPPIRDFQKYQNFRNPHMIWKFTWGHFYIVERKINNENWSTIYTYQVPSTTTEIPDTDFVDTSINLLRWQGFVKYRIYNKIYDELSIPSCELVWDTRPQVNSPAND